jgi:VanZ family protein
MKSKWHWLWLAVLVAWSIGLLIPDPLGRAQGPGDAGITAVYLISKVGHLAVYAALAALACRLPGRTWLLAVLALHAGLGEWLQFQFTSRTGSVLDVGIDLAGIALGCALAWPRKKAPAETINPPPGVSNH